MVYLTGDTHGELDRFKDGELRRAGKGDFVVVLGDFGFVRTRNTVLASSIKSACASAVHRNCCGP